MIIKEKNRYFIARPDVTSDGVDCIFYGWTTDISEATDTFTSKEEAMRIMSRIGFQYNKDKVEEVERVDDNV